MRTGEAILLGGGLFIAYSLMRKSAGIQTLQYYPYGIKKIEFDGITPVMVVQIAVQNTSNQYYTLKSFAGSLYFNNDNIGNASSFLGVSIPPNAETILEVRVRMNLIQLVSNIITQIKQGTFRGTIKLDAFVNVDNIQAPVKVEYKFS